MSKQREVSMAPYLEGGTLVVNIQTARLPIYQAAVELYDDPDIIIHNKSNKCAYSSTHSLHLLQDPYKNNTHLFWQTFCMVEDELLNNARSKAAAFITKKFLERITHGNGKRRNKEANS